VAQGGFPGAEWVGGLKEGVATDETADQAKCWKNWCPSPQGKSGEKVGDVVSLNILQDNLFMHFII